MSWGPFAVEEEIAASAANVGAHVGLPPSIAYAFTDLGNSERLVDQHGADLRCVTGLGWHCYDGKRWRQDDTGERFRRAKITVRRMYAEASASNVEPVRKACADWAKRSESLDRIKAMVSLAEHDERIAIRASDLDADACALNVGNGTIDLRTGILGPHRREDLITKLAPVPFDPESQAPTFLDFLDRVFDGNTDLSLFLQRFVGYALTGDVREQVLLFAHGEGSNGKSTLFDLLLEMLGDYAITAAPGLLVAKRHEGHPTERAHLFGARMVSSVEIGEGARWNEELVKQLTGGDAITARKMRENFFSFRPTHKLCISANHRPTVRGTDHAIWRRIRLLPFPMRFEGLNRDSNLPAKLRAELPGVLRWAVDGCLEWQRSGLAAPPSVLAATEAYRKEEDVLGTFVDERCTCLPQASVTAAALYTEYVEWARSAGEQALTQKAFGTALTVRGFSRGRTATARLWRGIGLRCGHMTPGDAGRGTGGGPSDFPEGPPEDASRDVSSPSGMPS